MRIFQITTDSQSPLLSFLEIRRFVKTCFVQQRHWLILFIYYSFIPWKFVYLITRHHFKWCVSIWPRPNLDKISKAVECLEKISVRGLWLLDIPSWSHDRLMKNWIITNVVALELYTNSCAIFRTPENFKKHSAALL